MIRSSTGILCAVLSMSGVMCAAAAAQTPVTPGTPSSRSSSPPVPPRPIDPGVGDVSPLSTSWRDPRVDLRQPVGFENVYRVPGRDDLLMRSSGAVTAVFPQSAYANTGSGRFAMIPAGTVFYIGDPRRMNTSILGDDDASKRVQNRIDSYRGPSTESLNPQPVDLRTAAPRTLPPQSQAAPVTAETNEPIAISVGPTIANDQQFRDRRVAELMAQAASAVHRKQPAQK